VGLSVLQAAKFRELFDDLPVADVRPRGYVHLDADLMHRGRRRCLEDRLAKPEAGDDVGLQGWELADELMKQFPRAQCYDIVGDQLFVDDYRNNSHGAA